MQSPSSFPSKTQHIRIQPLPTSLSFSPFLPSSLHLLLPSNATQNDLQSQCNTVPVKVSVTGFIKLTIILKFIWKWRDVNS